MIVAGVDEVGRGSIAGPLLVVCAAFEVSAWSASEPVPCPVPGVKDSKAFKNRSSRESVSTAILKESTFRGRGRGIISSADITARGMTWALRSAFLRAVQTLPAVPDLLLVDGNSKVEGWAGEQIWGPKGDSRWWPVSAASVLAKVERDGWMDAQDTIYPGYGFIRHSGYGTPEHFSAIATLGITPIHRANFVRSYFKSRPSES
jgi:ribonuclease HII